MRETQLYTRSSPPDISKETTLNPAVCRNSGQDRALGIENRQSMMGENHVASERENERKADTHGRCIALCIKQTVFSENRGVSEEGARENGMM